MLVLPPLVLVVVVAAPLVVVSPVAAVPLAAVAVRTPEAARRYQVARRRRVQPDVREHVLEAAARPHRVAEQLRAEAAGAVLAVRVVAVATEAETVVLRRTDLVYRHGTWFEEK